MTKKTILGQGAWYLVYGAGERTYITTTFTFDSANQLVSSTCNGVTTTYEYDAAGRLVKEGDKTYRYGYLDKVLSVTDGEKTYSYDYHVDGQIANANYGETSESFLWDGLALVKRGEASFINEPHVGGGNPVASSKGTSYFNDMLGTTVGSKSNGKYSAAALTAFGENHLTTEPPNHQTFFTGKPMVEGLGHAFLMRNYRASIAKWQTADPMGYPDGWNALAYCNNGVTSAVDLWGAKRYKINEVEYDDPVEHHSEFLGFGYDPYVGLFYIDYVEYDTSPHHHKWDDAEPDNDWIDEMLESITSGASIYAVTTFLAGSAFYVASAVSAAVGAVPVTIVTLKLGTDFLAASGASMTITIGAAMADRVYQGREGNLSIVEQHDEQTLKSFNFKSRREYVE